MNSAKNTSQSEAKKVFPFGEDLDGAFPFGEARPDDAVGRDLDGAGAGAVPVAFAIRKAVKEDCKRMLELVKELAIYERAPDEVSVTLEHFTDSGFGERPVWWAYVVTSKIEGEEIILGFAMYYIRFSTWKGQRMYLEDFIVTEQARGKGIGKLLFDKLIEVAKEENFSGIAWQVLHWNEPAINFYKKYYNATIEEGWLNCSLKIENKFGS